MLLKVNPELFVHQRFDKPLDLAIAELGFCLSFKLRFWDFHADDGCQTLSNILALKTLLILFEEAE